LGLTLVVAACGDDDADSNATSGTSAATATSAATESTTAATTAAETTTTTAAAETTTAALTGPAAFFAAAADFVGTYSGDWNNTTFGSTGAMFINVLEVNTKAGFLLIEIDLDGSVFGLADPDAFVIEVSIDGDNLHVGFSEFLGTSSFEIDEFGNFTMTAEPLSLGLPLEIEGGLTDIGFGGTYNIPGLAEGTWAVAPDA
jgi:hypothetical protein